MDNLLKRNTQDIAGNHRFEVKARDRDFNEDPTPAAVHFTVIPPVWQQGWFISILIILLGAIGLSVAQTMRVIQRDRQLREEAEEELRTARNLQMGLMPSEHPQLEGFDIAGRCIPAADVGGDFFQYFHHTNGRLTFTLADVTGHAMQAAIPVVMFSGVLKSEMRQEYTIDTLFQTLNNTMHETLDNQTFICFEVGELEPSTKMLRVSNGGCPFPFATHIKKCKLPLFVTDPNFPGTLCQIEILFFFHLCNRI